MTQEMIKVQGLKKAFEEKVVLNGVSLELKSGENLVVLGRSGSGKSVLIKCIVGLIMADEGTVEVDGKNLYTLNDADLVEARRQIGFVFQGAALYDSMTVRDNLAFPLRRQKHSKNEINSRIVEALENVGLTEAIDKMPSELSGGMKKRIGLARALIMRPKIMLYDEPTTGLDTITSKEISDLILEIREKLNTSSIIITHDMACARKVSNRVLILKEGNFEAEGTYQELEKSTNDWVRAFFEQ